MSFAPSAEDDYASLKELEAAAQAYAKAQRHALVRRRYKLDNKPRTIRKVFSECTRSDPSGKGSSTSKQDSTKKRDRPFKLNVTYIKGTGVWTLTVVIVDHNHEDTRPSSHTPHRKKQLTACILQKTAVLSKYSDSLYGV